jgi:putative ABC transport system substrate-binding protein
MLDARRRQFITLLGGAAAWPLAARGQQPAMPVVGLLDPRSPDTLAGPTARISRWPEADWRWAENQIDRLPVIPEGHSNERAR